MATRHRHSIRLPDWDYRRAGWYFVTFGTFDRRYTLARVRGGQMRLTAAGEIVARAWEALPAHHPTVWLDAFVVMPNHIHGILVINRTTRGATRNHPGVSAGGLGTIVGAFKASCTRTIRRELDPRAVVWHRNYYERILADRDAVEAVRRYIAMNPIRWIQSRHR